MRRLIRVYTVCYSPCNFRHSQVVKSACSDLRTSMVRCKGDLIFRVCMVSSLISIHTVRSVFAESTSLAKNLPFFKQIAATWVCRLIWVYTGCICDKVHFLKLRVMGRYLIQYCPDILSELFNHLSWKSPLSTQRRVMRTALIVVVIVNAYVVKISSDPLSSSPNLVRTPQSGFTKTEEHLIRFSHNGEEKCREPSV